MATYKAGKRERAPTHPGAIVRSSLEALGLTPYRAAPIIGMTRAGLGKVVNEQSPLTTDTALRLSRLFGTGDKGAEHLLAMQLDYDLWEAKQRLRDELAKIKPAPRP